MSKLIKTIQDESCAEAWLAAVVHLLSCSKNETYNLSLAIEFPDRMNETDRLITKAVEVFLRSRKQSPLLTVAGTIFPANHYLRGGARGVYETFPEQFSQLKSDNSTWGTYAMRMLERQGKNGKINPLKVLIEKIKKLKERNRSAYEINIMDDQMFELPLYWTAEDLNRHIPQPCLSHLTFKKYTDNTLMLAVFYRSHFYITKALGNLIGLAQLQSFAASETGLGVGPLICHSTHARVDTVSGSFGIPDVRQLVAECKKLRD